MSAKRVFFYGAVCFLSFVFSLPGFAQRHKTAKIIGYVQNREGKALAGASVYIPGTEYNTTVGKDGHYVLAVDPGKYDVISSAVGYLAEKKQIVLRSDPNTTIEQVVVRGKSAIQEVRETPFNVVALDATSHYNSTLNLAHLLDKASGVKIRETGGVGSDMNITLNGFTGRNIR